MNTLTRDSTEDDIKAEIKNRLEFEGYILDDPFIQSQFYQTLVQKIKEILLEEGDPK